MATCSSARTTMSRHGRLRGTVTLLTLLTAAALLATAPTGVRGGIISLLQNNVLGSAEFHRQQSWPFDPSVSARRAPEFIALHGDKSEKLIERIGLGLDGRQAERREQQSVRDFLYDQQQRQEEEEEEEERRRRLQDQSHRGGGVYVRPDYDPAAPRLRVLSGNERR